MPTITRRIAEQHEALVLRLEALAARIAAVGARQPGLALGPDIRAAAEALLADCRPFLPRLGRLPPAAPSYGGLAVQLGEVRARLESFELRHSAWDGSRKCRTWRLAGGAPLPVARLHPQPAIAEAKERDPEQSIIKKKLIRRIAVLYAEGYDDALAGRPPRMQPGPLV